MPTKTHRKNRVISIRFTERQYAAVSHFAQQDGRSMNSLVEAAVMDYIRRNRHRLAIEKEKDVPEES